MKKAEKKRHEKLTKEIESLDRKICETCDSPFYSDKEYQNKCSVCFKLEKDYKILIGDKQCKCLQEELSDCYEEIERIEKRLEKVEKQARKYRREAHSAKKKVPLTSSGNKMVLDKSLQRKLLRLCHPDTHQIESKKKLAQEVTQWLLQQPISK